MYANHVSGCYCIKQWMCFLVSACNICNGKDNLIAEPIKASHISFLNPVQQEWHNWGFGAKILALLAPKGTASGSWSKQACSVLLIITWAGKGCFGISQTCSVKKRECTLIFLQALEIVFKHKNFSPKMITFRNRKEELMT